MRNSMLCLDAPVHKQVRGQGSSPPPAPSRRQKNVSALFSIRLDMLEPPTFHTRSPLLSQQHWNVWRNTPAQDPFSFSR
jgi:hypothetical protein